MNIECDGATLKELESAFRFNDAVLRHLTLKLKKAVTEPSPLAKTEEKDDSVTNVAA
jgi:small subunit ribosomal protein S6